MDRRYVGIDLHRRRSVIYAMDAEGEKLFCDRIDNDSLRLLEVVGAGRRGRGGGDRSDVRLVLGGRPAQGGRLLGASGASVGERLGEAAGEERRTRRPRPGGPLASGSPRGGVDRAAGGPRGTRAGPLSREAGAAAQWSQSTGAHGDGQGRRATRDERHVRPERPAALSTRWSSPTRTWCASSRCAT